MTATDVVVSWWSALERRHLATLTFQEVRRALQALSALYVERRGTHLRRGDALGSAGKRAAFALFYGPLHLEVVATIVRGLQAASAPVERVLDLGCGTGAAGAAWALEQPREIRLEGVDRSGWALGEARWNWARLGLHGEVRRGELLEAELPGRGAGIVCAFAVNELAADARGVLLARLLEAAARGARVLVVEPLSKQAAPWWPEWSQGFLAAGGRNDLWRLPWRRSERLALLDRAAGLDHREIGGRSLWLPGSLAR